MLQKRAYALALCLVAVGSIALVASSLGTIEWTVCTIVQSNKTNATEPPYCEVRRTLGLFTAQDVKNSDCLQQGSKKTYSVYNKEVLQFNHAMQYMVVVFCGMSMLCAFCAMAVSGLNICQDPYETCLTSVAIFAYNIAGFACSLLAVIMYVALMYTDLEDSLVFAKPLNADINVYRDQGYVMEAARFGYSFVLLAVSLITYLMGITFLVASEKDVTTKLRNACCSQKESRENKDFMMF